MPDVLIELFSEEIPARMQTRAAEDLRKLVTDGLVEAGLSYAHARAFSTPRRLVLALEGLSAESPTLREDRKGPKVGAPQQALDGFLRSTGLTMEQLHVHEDKKGAFYVAHFQKPGRPAAAILAEVLEKTIRSFPWPKSMRWGSGALRWVRPLHSIIALMVTEAGAEVVPLDIDGITAGNTTRGHRFMAPGAFTVSSFEDYAAKLKRAFVVLDAAERADMIEHEVKNRAFALGLEPIEDKGLLAEVAGLVEWPVVLMGEIGAEFLDLPPEVLQTSMREHQKFFSLKDASGRIVRFVTVANRETADNGATILKGNQKVLTARLSDAKFFWENDLRVVRNEGLTGMAEGLANVTFHNKLGSQKARIDRIAALAREIAPLVGASPDLAEEAARVAKADLRSSMVGEFPELQGTMGVYYAKAAGLPEAVANACKAHYQPLGPSDEVPSEPVSVAVALADKIDTLTGFWAIDEKPTGSKDPFALRRAALGVIRLVLERDASLPLTSNLANHIFLHRTGQTLASIEAMQAEYDRVLSDSNRIHAEAERGLVEQFPAAAEAAMVAKKGDLVRMKDHNDLLLAEVSEAVVRAADLLAFFHDRLKVFLKDQGIRHDVIDACLAMPGNDDLTLLVKRAEALSAFLKTDDGENLLQGFKRANNILTQAEAKDGVEYSFGAEAKFAETDEERALFAALDQAEAQIAPAMAAEDFAAAMSAMAALRAPIDAFFTAVQINTDNQIVRRNRLNLLHRIRTTCAGVADLTKLEG
ncbi:glycine--tRNA ligase subunit beta [Pararhodobacter aggregans]|uniref:Glycine--tRNA ligase beta subunit n=1 Tax=Pararhodobacter aggregans TaxID=404875 RepID=A0A2T7UVU1_9RHOB|nr:glycine--tRNA ligase subunit beta [Pararhodobacter aggregans]PTW99573.1 glycyl-tRNA synthetase beta chain [Pararhodobacter aggregans]PVE48900.1 glycine--tRNA ligase subunit beta [Pararhodobacter aggregans]